MYFVKRNLAFLFGANGMVALMSTSQMVRGVLINGRKLAKLRVAKFLSQEELARRSGLAKGSIARYESLDVVGVLPVKFSALANALGFEPEEMRRNLAPEAEFGTNDPEHVVVPLVKPYAVLKQATEIADRDHISVEEALERMHPTVTPPQGESTAAKPRDALEFLKKRGLTPEALRAEKARDATRPYVSLTPDDLVRVGPERITVVTEVTATGKRDFHTGEQEVIELPEGLGVRLHGQCMDPAFEDGDVVRIDRSAWERDGFVSGKIYYVHFRDGSATFKQVLVDPDRVHIVLVPLNQGPPDDGGLIGRQAPDRFHRPFKERRENVLWAARLVRAGK